MTSLIENNLPFQKAIRYVFKNEGGFVNDVDDPGGATNFGVTQGVLSQYRGHPVSIDEVKSLSEHEAMIIFYELYWKPVACDRMAQTPIAIALFDVGVLYGVQTAAVMAQRTLKDCDFPLVLDGHIGPKTIAALNSVNVTKFMGTLIAHLENRIDRIVATRPKSIKFRDGWRVRARKLQTLISGVG